jgi:arylsulfatase A-like enzyme
MNLCRMDKPNLTAFGGTLKISAWAKAHPTRLIKNTNSYVMYLWLLVSIITALATAGCGRLKPQMLIDEQVKVPQRKVVIFFADGVNREVFRQMQAAGELPNIDKYLLQRGVRVKNAVTAIPSITYAITTTFVTGQVPAHHGVLGNRFFDRKKLFFADYTTTKTYRDVDNHYHPENIYEILDDRFSVTIQTPVRRGVYRKIDNWATSGIRWFFGQITEIDALTAERFELIGAISRRARRWPALIFAYFPAADEMGHRHGPASKKYHQALTNLDEQIGRICAALEANGLLESTHLIFVTDHGIAGCARENYLDISSLLKNEFSLKLTKSGPDERTHYSDRADYFRRYEAVVVNGGNRRVAIHVRNGEDWSRPASLAQIVPLAKFLVQQQAVCLVAYRGQKGFVLQNHRGRAVVERNNTAHANNLDEKQYRYSVIDGEDPLDYANSLRDSGLLDGKYHTGRDWLEATVRSEYPDLVVQIAEMFDSARAGDLAVFAADGWDFARENVGGHGSVRAGDMLVPMIFAGPGIGAGKTIATARTVDIAPTVIDMIDNSRLEHYQFDGRSLLKELTR